jgi:hypothetical protein
MNILVQEEQNSPTAQSAVASVAETAAPTRQVVSPITGEKLAQDYLQRQLEVLRIEARNRKLRIRMLIGVCCLAPVAVLLFSLMSGATSNIFTFYVPFIGVFPASFAGIHLMSASQKKAAAALASQDDLRAIGPMCEMLSLGSDTGESWTIQKYLIRNLPRLRATDRRLINAAQLTSLHKHLAGANAFSSDLVLAILKALPYIGDARSEQVVRRLLDGRLRPGLQSAVRHAAHECLQSMADQQMRNEQALTLLRGSERESVGDANLLRPLAGQMVTEPPDQLVRPHVPLLQGEVRACPEREAEG